MSQISKDDNASQTYVVKRFKPGGNGLMEAIHAQSTYEIHVLQGPVRSGPTREYLILERGKKWIADPLKESRPYQDVDWSVYIMVDEWTEIKGKGRVPWKNDAPHKVLKAMVKLYPHNLDHFDACDAPDKLKVSKIRLRVLMTEIRKLVGKDVLPDGCRALSQHATIIIERRG